MDAVPQCGVFDRSSMTTPLDLVMELATLTIPSDAKERLIRGARAKKLKRDMPTPGHYHEVIIIIVRSRLPLP